jgi:hypothetical protein
MQTPSIRPAPSLIVVLTCLVATFFSSLAIAQQPFTQGSKRVTVIAGAGSSFDENYAILGVGAGYFLTDGLEIGINWQTWLGGDPTINQITPELTYVFRNKSNFDPYVGVLYRRTFIADRDDLSAYGARAGINFSTGPRSYIGFGMVYLDYKDCSVTKYSDCSDSYPEIAFGFFR